MMATTPVYKEKVANNETPKPFPLGKFDIIFKTVDNIDQCKLFAFCDDHRSKKCSKHIARAIAQLNPEIIGVEAVPSMKELSRCKGHAVLKNDLGIENPNETVRVIGWDAEQKILDSIGTPIYAVPSIIETLARKNMLLEMVQCTQMVCEPLSEEQRTILLPMLKSLNEVIDTRSKLRKQLAIMEASPSQILEIKNKIAKYKEEAVKLKKIAEEIWPDSSEAGCEAAKASLSEEEYSKLGLAKQSFNNTFKHLKELIKQLEYMETTSSQMPEIKNKLAECDQFLGELQKTAKTIGETLPQDCNVLPIFSSLEAIIQLIDDRSELQNALANLCTEESIMRTFPFRTTAMADTVDKITEWQKEGIIKGNIVIHGGGIHFKTLECDKDKKEYCLEPFYRALSQHPAAMVLCPKVVSNVIRKQDANHQDSKIERSLASMKMEKNQARFNYIGSLVETIKQRIQKGKHAKVRKDIDELKYVNKKFPEKLFAIMDDVCKGTPHPEDPQFGRKALEGEKGFDIDPALKLQALDQFYQEVAESLGFKV